MEEALLHRHNSGSNSGSQRSHVHRGFRRRSDAIAYGSRYQKAAALVDLVFNFHPLLPPPIFVVYLFIYSIKSNDVFVSVPFLQI